MADWSVIRTTLEAWVLDISGLTTYWRRRPRGPHFGDAYALLDISGRRTIGNDEIVVEYDSTAAAGSEIRRYQTGARQFTFSVQVRTSRTSDDTDALHYTSLLRDATVLPTRTHDTFHDADIAFARVLSEVDLEYELDGREMSVAQLDLLMNATALVEDTATGYIETLIDFDLIDPENPAPPLWTGDIEVD